MSKLLYLAHRIPYPPNKGDKIRSFHTLKHLAEKHRIYLGAFVDDQDDWQYRKDLEKICEEVFLCPLNSIKAKLRSIKGFYRREPLTLSYYDDRRMREWVRRTMQGKGVRNTYVFSSSMAQYIEDGEFTAETNIADFVDVDSDKWEQYASVKRWPMSWLYGREAHYLQQYEKRLASMFDAIMFVSSYEAEFFGKIAPESTSRIGWINNGVDFNYFSPARNYQQQLESEKKIIVFTGAMDYWANVDAVCWFVSEVFNKVHEVLPESLFFIVGAKPVKNVRQLSASPGVVVTGSVADVRPYLAHAHLSVAPLRIARGVQNKVLESMAMGVPVVATHAAVEGILPATREQVMVCDEPDQMQKLVIQCLLKGINTQQKQAVRKSIIEEYSWKKNLSHIDRYYSA